MSGIFKTKILNRFLCLVILQIFLVSNFSWAADDLRANDLVYSSATLSPSLQISADALKQYFAQSFDLKTAANIDPVIKDICLELYKAKDKTTKIEVLALEQGYRVKIRTQSNTPLVLHWGFNNWQKPFKEIWPQAENIRTYFDEQTKAMRTIVEASAEGDYVFNIDIPWELVSGINNIDFTFFCPETKEYKKAIENKDYVVPVSNVLNLALARLAENAGADDPEKKHDLLNLINKRLAAAKDSAEIDENNIPLFYDAHENIITQIVKNKAGIRIDFWVVSNEPLVLHWGINDWQLPPKSIWPDRTLYKTRAYEKKAVQTQMHLASKDGLYQTSIYIPNQNLKEVKNIKYNVHYPNNGYWDNNNEEDYSLSLQAQDLIAALLPYATGRFAAHINAKQARGLLKNMAFFYAENMNYTDLLKLFQGMEGIAPGDDLEKKDVLGLILIAKLMNEGAVWDSDKAKIIISKQKISAAIAELIDKLDPLSVQWALYIFGLLDPSWVSILTHQLDYKQIYQDVQNSKIKDLPKFIQGIINSYDDLEGAPQVLSAESIDETCLIIKLKFNDQIISTKWGYPTKQQKYYYQNGIFELRDFGGNEFSPVGRKLSRYVDKEVIKTQISRLRGKGKKAIVDGISWQSPEALNSDNYMYYHHSLLEKDADVRNLLLSRGSSTILELPDGKKAWVFHRPDSSDQLSPNLKFGTKAAEYWRNYWLEYYKYFINEFDVDGFRVDLPGELNHHGDYSVFKSVCFDIVRYAAAKGKKIYFILETYHGYANIWGWDEFSALNHDPQIAQYGYKPFRCYYKPVMTSIYRGSAFDLRAAFERIAGSVQELVISITNFDEKKAEDIIPEKQRLKRYMELLYNFARAGFDVMIYLRDLGLGDILPMCGGDRVLWGGKLRVVAHKPATPRQFRQRLEQSTGDLLEQSPLYQAFKKSPQSPLSRLFFRGNKLVFYQPGKTPEVFDLDKMAKPAPPVKVMDSEEDINIWLQQQVYSLTNNEPQTQALREIENTLKRFKHSASAMAGKAVLALVCSETKNFAVWDQAKGQTQCLRMPVNKVLAIKNDHAFVVDIKQAGKSESRRIPALQIKQSGKYLAMVFGLAPGKYRFNFLWQEKHENQGWEEGNGYELEVSSPKTGQPELAVYIPRLSAEYLRDWDEMFYQAKDAGRNLLTGDMLTKGMLENIESSIDFTLRYEYGREILEQIKDKKKKQVFNILYNQISQNPRGRYSLLHHHHEKDFFKLAETVLESIPGLARPEAAPIWQYLDALKQADNPDQGEQSQIAVNIKLLGFMSGLFAQIEALSAAKPLELWLNIEAEFLIGQAI
ncbi:MAG: hypothetical protein V1747_07790 [Candidatus Omnitrophota bacterium]